MSSAASNSEESDKQRMGIEWARLRLDRQKSALEFRLRRQELAERASRGWKDLLANPLTLAIVGGFATLMTTIVSNHFTSSASTEAEKTKAKLSAEASKQALQADLIKKFVESPTTTTVRENLQFLIDAGLLPDYEAKIKTYLTTHPDQSPQIGTTSVSPLDGANYSSLVNEFFSASPTDVRLPLTVRTNNPAALYASSWQTHRPGFVGPLAQSSGAGVVVYRTPEHGIASWYALLRLYGYQPGKTFSLAEVAGRYAGADAKLSEHYMQEWSKYLPPNVTLFDIGKDDDILALSRAVFTEEAGQKLPWSDRQILFGITSERNHTLPP